MSKDKKLDELAGVSSTAVSAIITASGVRGAQQANADFVWFGPWAEKNLGPILKSAYVEASRQAEREKDEKERTW